MAVNDVAAVMAEVSVGKPLNATIEIGGPERGRLSDFVSKYIKAKHDEREVVARPDANYYGLQIDERSLVPADDARFITTKLEDWLCTAVK